MSSDAKTAVPENMHVAVDDGIWLRPAESSPAEPVIGFKDGIRVALWPAVRGPRGLFRICAPYVFPDQNRTLVNFIAVEPIVGDWRGLSELEHSKLDDMQGKRMWFTDEVSDSPKPALPWQTPRGKLGKIKVDGKDVETLSIVANVEAFDNGAKPIVQITFRADRPNEISFKSFAAKDSAEMKYCVLTATMGNFCRTRLLWLKDEVLDSTRIWPDYKGDGFVGTGDIPLHRLMKDKDGVIAAITPNETDLSKADMPPGGWVCNAKIATQYWRKYPGKISPDLKVRVNGRASYWGNHVPIPGGVAFENFEMLEPFTPAQEFAFGVTLKPPKQIGWK